MEVITCVLSKDLVHTILTMWMHDAIKSKTEELLKNYNEVFVRLPKETSEVPAEDGSASKVAETGLIYPKREHDWMGRPIYPNDPIADGK
jgi:hypothetical protein